MNKLNFQWKHFQRFAEFRKGWLVQVFLLTFFLAFTQGFGLMMLIPLLKFLNPTEDTAMHVVTRVFTKVLNVFHIQPSLGIVLLFFVIVLFLINFLQNRKTVLQAEYQHSFAGYLRKELYQKMIFSDWKVLTGLGKSEQLQAITSEIPKVTHFYFYLLNAATRSLIVLVYLVFGFIIASNLTVVLILLCTIEMLLFSKYLKKSYGLGKEGRKAFHRVLKNIDDFWISMKPAKVHKTEWFYFKKYAEADDAFVQNQSEQFHNNRKPQFFFNLLGIANIIILFLLSNQYFHVSLSVFIIILLLFSRMFPVLLALFNDINLMFANADSLNILEKYNLSSQLPINNNETSKIKNISNGISIENLTFAYHGQSLLFDKFSAFIPAGKMTGIVGRSGIGKTTLVDILCGLLSPQHGTIKIDGISLHQNGSGLNKLIAYLPQDSLFIDGTIRENLIWDSDTVFSDAQIKDILKKVNAEVFLKEKSLHIDSYISNFRFTFSGGELQRLAMARVLLRTPQLLILDEATSALDEYNENIIINLLKSLSGQTTIIFITHRKRLLQFFDVVIDLDTLNPNHMSDC